MYRTTASPAENLLTIQDVLGYLRVNARTIYRLIHEGTLPAVRVGRQWRIKRQDLDGFVAAQCVVAPSREE